MSGKAMYCIVQTQDNEPMVVKYLLPLYTSQKETSMSDLAMENVEALARGEENPLCPNGCYNNGNGCYCYTWFPTYREAN